MKSHPRASLRDSSSPRICKYTQIKQLTCSVFVQLWTGFSAYNNKRRSLNYNIPESDLIDLTETICADQKTWEG